MRDFWMATFQTGYIEVHRNRFAVTRDIADDQGELGVRCSASGPPTMRAQSGNPLRCCFDMMVGVGFLEIYDIEAGQLEDADRHADRSSHR